MRLSEFKSHLQTLNDVKFILPNGDSVPAHFHITEVGRVLKHFIDCGGVIRKENKVSFQLWEANDYEHRLSPEKLLNIIELSEEKLSITDDEIEVEYQGNTIGKYGVAFQDGQFVLQNTHTDCLAKDNCGIPESQIKRKMSLADLQKESSCCDPSSGCC